MLIRYCLTSFITLFLLYNFFIFPSFAENKKNNSLHFLNTSIDLFKNTYSCAPTFLIGRKNMRKNICVDSGSGDTFFAESHKGKLVSLIQKSENFEISLDAFFTKLKLPKECNSKIVIENSSIFKCMDNQIIIVNFYEDKFVFETEYCSYRFCKSDLNF